MSRGKDTTRYNQIAKKFLTEMDNTQTATPTIENTTLEKLPDVVTVEQSQLNELIEQNRTMKTELGLMVGLFKNFEGLITGKNVMSLALTIPKLIADPRITTQLEAVAPILEKYNKTS